MMRVFMKLIVVVLVSVMALSAAQCSKNPADDAQITICFAFQTLETEFWVGAHKAITETLRAKGKVIEHNANEDAILEAHGVSRKTYEKWLVDAKLVALTEPDKAEVARTACLDIIALRNWGSGSPPAKDPKPTAPPEKPALSATAARALLEAVAGGEA